jgi:hypothetical protein
VSCENTSARSSSPQQSRKAITKNGCAARAAAHVRRDRKRGNVAASVEAYKGAIHHAVMQSEGATPTRARR